MNTTLPYLAKQAAEQCQSWLLNLLIGTGHGSVLKTWSNEYGTNEVRLSVCVNGDNGHTIDAYRWTRAGGVIVSYDEDEILEALKVTL